MPLRSFVAVVTALVASPAAASSTRSYEDDT
jgi:hypothetical protein